MTPQDELRALVRLVLREKGMSQAAAARALGITAKHMSQMMTGRAPITLDWAARIAALCGQRIRIEIEPDPVDPVAELFAGGLA